MLCIVMKNHYIRPLKRWMPACGEQFDLFYYILYIRCAYEREIDQ